MTKKRFAFVPNPNRNFAIKWKLTQKIFLTTRHHNSFPHYVIKKTRYRDKPKPKLRRSGNAILKMNNHVQAKPKQSSYRDVPKPL